MSLGASLGLALASAVYPLLIPALLEWSRGFYSGVDLWRTPHLGARIVGLRWFLPSLAALCGLWTLALRQRAALSPPPVRLYVPLVIMGALIGGFLSYQLSSTVWIRYGRPVWDEYGRYARLLHAWLFAVDRNAEALLGFMRRDYHSNSPFVPLVVALGMELGLAMITSFRLACALATLAATVVTWRTLRGLEAERAPTVAALFLLWTNLAVARSLTFPQTDAFTLLWGALLVHAGVRRERHPGLARDLALGAVLALGLFVKLSLLPMLAVPGLWWLLARFVAPFRLAGTQTSEPGWSALARAAALTLLPLAAYLGFQRALGTAGLFLHELGMISSTQDAYWPFKLAAGVLTTGTFLVLLPPARRDWGAVDRLLLAWVALHVASVWLSGASGWNRFYLPALPALAVVGCKGLARLRTEAGDGALACFVVLAGAANYLALALDLYM